MNGKTIACTCLMIMAACLTALSQTKELDVDKMRSDAQRAQKKPAVSYDITDVKKTADTFEILYTINGSQEDEYEVTLALVRDSDPAFRIVPKETSGKIGTGAFAGKNNVIVWNYKKDLQKDLKGNDYRFDLGVRKLESGSFPWLWVGLGTAAAGGVAVLVLGGKGGGDTPQDGGGTNVTTIPAISISRPN